MIYRSCKIEENPDKQYSKALDYIWYDLNMPDQKYEELNIPTAKLRIDEYRNSSIFTSFGFGALGFIALLFLL